MFRRTFAFAFAIAFASLVLPSGAHALGSAIWSVDETVTVADAAHATREWRVTYDANHYGNKWTLAIPPGCTFADAHSSKGPLIASVNGGNVTVTSDSGEFFVDFSEPLKRDGAFLLAQGGPSASSDSPTSVRYQLPSGWTLAGWSGSAGLTAPMSGAWTRTGPFFVEAALIEPGVVDPGADARGKAKSVYRSADATLAPDKAKLDVTIVYDTDEFSPSWTLPVGAGLTLLGVDAPLPNTTSKLDGANVLVTAPYPFGHHLGARPFTLHFETTPAKFGGGFLRTNLSIPAGPTDPLKVDVDLGTMEWVGARAGDTSLPNLPTYNTTGPMALSIVTLAPPPPSTTRFTEGPYIVEAPAAKADAAKAAAKASAAALPAAAAFQPVGSIPLHVIYTDDPVFAGEEGLYHGHDAISIRASDLTTDATNLTPMRTLVHESTHALADRLRQGKPLDNSFLNEGLARLAETHVELAAAPGSILKCETSGLGNTRCTRDSSRVDPAKLQDFLKSGRTFNVEWNASTASETDRGFLYDYSGYVLFRYERASPPGALGQALTALAAKDAPGSADVIDALLRASPGMTRDQLLYPGKTEAAALAADAFQSAMGDAVAPPFPTASASSGGFAKTPGVSLGVVAVALVALAVVLRKQ